MPRDTDPDPSFQDRIIEVPKPHLAVMVLATILASLFVSAVGIIVYLWIRLVILPPFLQ